MALTQTERDALVGELAVSLEELRPKLPRGVTINMGSGDALLLGSALSITIAVLIGRTLRLEGAEQETARQYLGEIRRLREAVLSWVPDELNALLEAGAEAGLGLEDLPALLQPGVALEAEAADEPVEGA